MKPLLNRIAFSPRGQLVRIGLVLAVLCVWSQGADVSRPAKAPPSADWWSFKPIVRPAIPNAAMGKWGRTPIDAFIFETLGAKGMHPSVEADLRTLIRRVTYDLTGLPPSPDEIAAYLADAGADAYEKVVDRLLASPRYGERWGRHWLDTVHYGDTHGYDKDKIRPNAWPYRDYVIHAFNDDKPYGRFVREQLAGDWFYPDTADGILGLGFIASGPFDFVGQIELRDGTIDKTITRNLDRDDMVSTTMNTFVSLTVQCARCHNHKFDPIQQEDYYSLQAVFAAVDRADRPYISDPAIAQKRRDLQWQIESSTARGQEIEKRIPPAVAPELTALDAKIALLAKSNGRAERPEFGYHSGISLAQDKIKWVQIDLGAPAPIEFVVLVAAFDNFNNIGAGFGFPVRFKVEASDDAEFKSHVVSIADHTGGDMPNPGVRPQSFAAPAGTMARYVRVTATKLAPRQSDFNFAMGEMSVLTPGGVNIALARPVTAMDSIEAPVRWSKKNLVDGYYYGMGSSLPDLAKLQHERQTLLAASLDEKTRRELVDLRKTESGAAAELKALPPQPMVYAAATEFARAGSLVPTHGKPRPIYLLHRGSEKNPGKECGPGAVGFLNGLPARFDLPPGAPEAKRRAMLADWIVDARNPLAWRSIVNRVWQYHFGRGIVDSPNDFGRMGSTPTHPQLLDWLASEFRDGGEYLHTPQSIKSLQRLIVTSSVYRQSSASNADFEKIDGNNQFYWRMNRDRLDAEAIRDTVLLVSGQLDLKMGGPGYRDFGFLDDHSPHYKYLEYNPDDVATHRRSIYRLVVRSVPNPLMETLDCADPSQLVPRRNETLTALQALSLMNNPLMLRMAQHFAERVEKMAAEPKGQIEAAYRLALGRAPRADESRVLLEVARKDGMANVCRLIFNTNEFVFVD